MNQNYLFIASVGNNDIKFLITENDEEKLAEPRSNRGYLSIREIHEKLLTNEIPNTFKDVSGIQRKRETIKFKQENQAIKIELGKNQSIQTDDNNNYCIVAAKIQGLINTLKRKVAKKEIQIIGALFIGTERPKQRTEPIASHRLLAKYFAEQFDMEDAGELPDEADKPDTCPVYWLNQLKDLPDEEDGQGIYYEGTGLDYPVKRIVAKRIDDSIKQFLEYFKQHSPHIFLSDTGGINDLKDLLSASVCFRANNDVLETPQTEKSEAFDTDAFDILISEKHLISRRQSLRIKTLVESRILEGDIAGAWSACAHIHQHDNNTNHDIWTHAIEAVKNYYAGDNNFTLNNIINECIPEATINAFRQLDQILQELTTTEEEDFQKQSQSALTQTLFHIESALQASSKNEINIIQATIHSSSLNDQLLRTCIYHYLNTHRTDFTYLKDTLKFDNDEVLKNSWNDAQDCRFKITGSGNTTKKINTFGGRHRWRATLKQDSNLKIANTYHQRMIYPNNQHNKSLNQWRNTIAHGLGMQSRDRQNVLQIAIASNQNTKPLWNPELGDASKLPFSTGCCFLNQHYTRQIEEKLGYNIGSSQQKYIELQQLLLQIIRSSIYIP